MAELLARTGYWPPDVPFEPRDLFTVLEVLSEG